MPFLGGVVFGTVREECIANDIPGYRRGLVAEDAVYDGTDGMREIFRIPMNGPVQVKRVRGNPDASDKMTDQFLGRVDE